MYLLSQFNDAWKRRKPFTDYECIGAEDYKCVLQAWVLTGSLAEADAFMEGRGWFLASVALDWAGAEPEEVFERMWPILSVLFGVQGDRKMVGGELYQAWCRSGAPKDEMADWLVTSLEHCRMSAHLPLQ